MHGQELPVRVCLPACIIRIIQRMLSDLISAELGAEHCDNYMCVVSVNLYEAYFFGHMIDRDDAGKNRCRLYYVRSRTK